MAESMLILEIGAVEKITDPSAEQISHYLRLMPPTSPFLILSREFNTFMQAAPAGDRYRLEDRQDGRQRFVIVPVNEADRLLQLYRADDPSFAQSAAWRKLSVWNDPYSSASLILLSLGAIILAGWGIWQWLHSY